MRGCLSADDARSSDEERDRDELPGGVPRTWEELSDEACAGIFLLTRSPAVEGAAKAFRDTERLIEAFARGDVSVRTPIRIGPVTTTAGRHLVRACLPASLRGRLGEPPWGRPALEETLVGICRELHVEIAARCRDALELLGRFESDRSGLSLGHSDLVPSPTKRDLVGAAMAAVDTVAAEYQTGTITDGERYNRILDVWADVAARVAQETRFGRRHGDPLSAFQQSTRQQLHDAKLRSMMGAVHLPDGSTSERPVIGSYGEGLGPHEYFLTAMDGRSEVREEAVREGVATSLLHDLGHALLDVRIVTRDCGNVHGVRFESLHRARSQGIHLTLGQRLIGRVLSSDLVAEDTVIAASGELVTAAIAAAIDASAVTFAWVRDPVTCEAEEGVCASCFGLDPLDGVWPADGDHVGLRAASAIARGARAFKRKTFHIC